MTEGQGKATGPQRRPRRPTPAPAEQVEREPVTAEMARRRDYDALRARIREQCDQCGERLDNMPEGIALRTEPVDDTLIALRDIERRVTMLRLDLDQLGCSL